MSTIPTASYDRLVLDNANDNRRIGTEGGIGAAALVITLIYLLYEAVLSQPASAEPILAGSSIILPSINPNLHHSEWSRITALTPLKSSAIPTSDLSPVLDSPTYAAPSPDVSSYHPPDVSHLPYVSQLSNVVAIAENPVSTSPSSFASFNSAFPKAASSQLPEELEQHPVYRASSSIHPGPGNPGGGSIATPLPSYRVLVVVSTDQELLATSLNGASHADFSGGQVAIREATLITKGSFDQIQVFTDRLLSASSRSLEDSSGVSLALQHVGVENSLLDPSGVGAYIHISVEDLLAISQSAGTTLLTAVDQQVHGLRETDVHMTDSSDLVEVRSSADIRFRGSSDNEDWSQQIDIRVTGLKGRAPDLRDDYLEPSLSPGNKVLLGSGDNSMNVSVGIGDNSSWDVDLLRAPLEAPASVADALPPSQSLLNLEAVAVEDYYIAGGGGRDSISLRAGIDLDFVDAWHREMRELSLDEEALAARAVSMRRSVLETGGGSDQAILEGVVESSIIKLGSGSDQLFVNGAIKSSVIELGDGNDVVLLINPPELTGRLLGGAGLDALSFSGTTQSVLLDMNGGVAGGLSVDSIEIAVGGEANDVLIAGDDTLWLDGAGGEDLYILDSRRLDSGAVSSLSLSLSPDDILRGHEGLMRWDSAANTYHLQRGFLLESAFDAQTDFATGVELLPIGQLDSVLSYLGASFASGLGADADSSSRGPWGVALDGDSGVGSGNILIQRDVESLLGYRQISALASNVPLDSVDTALG